MKLLQIQRNNKIAACMITLGFLAELLLLVILLRNYPHYPPSLTKALTGTHILAAFTSAWGVYVFHESKHGIAPYIFTITLTLPIAGYLEAVQAITSPEKEPDNELMQHFDSLVNPQISSIKQKTHPAKTGTPSQKAILHPSHIEDLHENKGHLEKLVLIRNLGKTSGKTSVEALKNLLEDPHMDVRYYAGEELAAIQDRYNLLINELKNIIRNKPDNHETYLELGAVSIEYAFSGLLEKESSTDMLQQAETSLELSLKLERNSKAAQILLGKTLFYQKKYAESAQCLENISQTPREDTIVTLAQCQWHLKNYRKLKKSINHLENHPELLSAEEREAVEEFIKGWKNKHVQL